MIMSDDEALTPRARARTSPEGLMRPSVAQLVAGAEKRQFSSPEEEQSNAQRMKALRKRVEQESASPMSSLYSIAGISREGTVQVTDIAAQQVSEHRASTSSRQDIIDQVRCTVRNIMEVVTNSKLNKADTNKIAAYGHDLISLMAAMEVRALELELAAAKSEQKKAEAERKLAQSDLRASVGTIDPSLTKGTYSAALKLPKGKDPISMPVCRGPVLAFYPAEPEGPLKTAEDTKAELKKSVNPKQAGIQIDKVRKVGNAGVVVQTTSQEAALKLKTAVPRSLRITEPRQRLPLVALRGFDEDPKEEDVLQGLYEQNIEGSEHGWSLESLKKEARVAFKKTWRGGHRTTVVLQCSPRLRDYLVSQTRLYVGWDVVVPCDYIEVTCCNRCQQYGHPAKYCRSKEEVCGRCGDIGHNKEACKSTVERCATCKRFNRPDASSHTTMAKVCPGRMHAENRAVATTQYG